MRSLRLRLVDHHHRRVDRNVTGRQLDRACPAFDGDPARRFDRYLGHRLNRYCLRRRFNRDIPRTCRHGDIPHARCFGNVPLVYLDGPVTLLDGDAVVPGLNRACFIHVNGRGPIVLHNPRFIVLNQRVVILLRLEVHLFRPILILKAEHVVVGGSAARARVRLKAALGLVVRQREDGHVGAVIKAPDHIRQIRIAFLETHRHFIAHARDPLVSPQTILTRPWLNHPQPTGVFGFPVPMETNTNPAILVGPDLFGIARRRFIDYERGLQAVHYRLRRLFQMLVSHARRNATELVVVRCRKIVAIPIRWLLNRPVSYFGEEPTACSITARNVDLIARGKCATSGPAADLNPQWPPLPPSESDLASLPRE